MSEYHQSGDAAQSESWSALERTVERFQDAWRQGSRPLLDEYLRGGEARMPELLVKLICAELELRLQAGEAARVEEYLTRYPQLGEDRQTVLVLLQTEVRLRAAREPQLSGDEYRRRFPVFAGELSEEFSTLSRDAVPTFPPTLDTRTSNATLTARSDLPDIPGFELIKELGRGAMGIVYLARQLGLARLVALKMILRADHANSEDRQRFHIEARALGRLKHPNIVQIYDVSEYRGQPFFVLEYVEGSTLADRLANGPLSVTETVELLIELARAMHAAHEQNIVHRDLKPANVLLATDGTPKISDFGLAKHLDAETVRTQSGAILGTPAYMAPEQATGQSKAIGPSVDIFALGALFYELLAGQTPFRGRNVWDVLHKVQTEEPISLRRLMPRLPRDLETICRKCLEKKAERRYRTALALAEDLERFRAGEPILARPSRVWERGAKWARRHPAPAALLAVIVLATAALIGGAVAANVRLQKALDKRTNELNAVQELRDREAEQRQEELRRGLNHNQYVSDVQQAAQLWRLGEVSQCYDFMTRCPWTEGKDDPRGFEWYCLRRWCDRQPRVLEGHTAAVNGIRFHPDGTLLASCGDDQTIRLWDATTGQPRGRLTGHRGRVQAIAFSPDGKILASAGQDHSIRLWDWAGQRQQANSMEGGAPIESLELSPGGEWLAFRCQGGTEVQLWNYQTRRVHHVWPSGAEPALSLAFAPDGRSLALGYQDGRIKLEDVAQKKELGRLLAKHSVNALAFSRKSSLLAAAGGDGLVTLWDAQTHERVGELAGHTGKVNSLVFSPDDRTLLSASDDGTVRCWDVFSQRLEAVYRARSYPFHSVGFHPEGRVFAAGGSDGFLGLWSAAIPQRTRTLPLAVDPAGPLAFSPDGKWLASAGMDRTVCLLDSATRRLQQTFRGGHGAWQDLAFSPDGKHLAAACSDRRVHVWETRSGQAAHQLLGHQDTVRCVAYSRDGKWLAAGGADRRLALLEMPSGQLRTTFEAHKDAVTAVAFHPKGEVLATASPDKTIKLWTVPDGRLLRQEVQDDEVLGMTFLDEGSTLLVNGESNGVSCRKYSREQGLSPAKSFTDRKQFLALSPRAGLLIGSNLGSIEGFNFRTGTKQFRLSHDGGVRQLALSPDGSTLAFDRRGGSLEWYELRRDQLLTTPEELPQPVHSLAFGARGEMLITGSRGGGGKNIRRFFPFGVVVDWRAKNLVGDLVRFWSLPSGQAREFMSETPTLAGHPYVAVSPDGRTLATGADDGTVSLWDLATGQRRSRLLASRHSRTYITVLNAILATKYYSMQPAFDGDEMRALAFSPDGQLLAAATEDGQVQLWKASSGKEWATLPGKHEDVSCLAFSSDGVVLAVNKGKDIELWNVAGTPDLRQRLQGCTGVVRGLAFSPDGETLAGSSDNWDIHLWKTANGQEIKQFHGHISRVSSLAFHPDGQTLASAGWDGTVRLWHVATGRELMVLHRGGDRIHAVAFSPDGAVLAAGGENHGRGDVYFWRTASRPSLVVKRQPR